MKTTDKKVYLEILRVFAIFLALYCHTGMDAVYRFVGAGNAGSYVLSVGMRVLASTCNIVFFMISGALLLGKEESFSKVLKGRALKMAVVILLFSFFQMIWEFYHVEGTAWDLIGFFKEVYEGPYITQYWFLYEYLGFLLCLPLLRILVKHMELKHYLYVFGAYVLVAGVLPLLEGVTGLEGFGVNIPFLASTWVFSLAGYFIEHVYWERLYEKKVLLWVNLVGLAAFVGHCFVVADRYVSGDINPQNMGLLLLITGTIFVDIKVLCEKLSLTGLVSKMIVFIGTGVFGVYLLEPQMRTMYHFIYEALEPYITWLPATVLWLLPAILTGSVIMNVLKRIPVVKKLF